MPDKPNKLNQPLTGTGTPRNDREWRQGQKKSQQVCKLRLAVVLLAILLIGFLVGAGWIAYSIFSGGSFAKICPSDTGAAKTCTTLECLSAASRMLQYMNTSADPCSDFYEYTCGRFDRIEFIPHGKSRQTQFSLLGDKMARISRAIFDRPLHKPPYAEAHGKAKRFFDACINLTAINSRVGVATIQRVVEEFGGFLLSSQSRIPDDWSLTKQLIIRSRYSTSGLFTFGVGQDDRNATRNVLSLDQGGIGLPSREYYMNKTIENDAILNAYAVFLSSIAKNLVGEENVEIEHVLNVIRFEQQLSRIFASQAERRQWDTMYSIMSFDELQKIGPHIKWREFFTNVLDESLGDDASKRLSPNQVVVYGKSYFHRLNRLLNALLNASSIQPKGPMLTRTTRRFSTPKMTTVEDEGDDEDDNEDAEAAADEQPVKASSTSRSDTDPEGARILHNYLVFRAVQRYVAQLPTDFRDLSETLQSAITGKKGQPDLWETCVFEAMDMLGFAVGSIYVKDHFGISAKVKGEEMIREIRKTFITRINELTWMADETKARAVEKALAMRHNIGFPDWSINDTTLDAYYEGFNVTNDHLQNYMNYHTYTVRRAMKKLGEPPDPERWSMAPMQINAYYTASQNKIMFPAGILQPPFFSESVPDALNFGAIGMVIGHEIVHAFDDTGRLFGKNGELHMWWDNATDKQFREKTRCISEQYSRYTINGLNVRGNQTVGENIADNGGIRIAFRAYKSYSDRVNGVDADTKLPGIQLTSDQLFFVSFAQIWCATYTHESLRHQIVSNPHTPSRYRIIGTVVNSHEFAKAFQCPGGKYHGSNDYTTYAIPPTTPGTSTTTTTTTTAPRNSSAAARAAPSLPPERCEVW